MSEPSPGGGATGVVAYWRCIPGVFSFVFSSLCLLSACMVYKSTDCTSTSFWVRISNQIKSIEKERKEDFGWVFNAKLLYL